MENDLGFQTTLNNFLENDNDGYGNFDRDREWDKIMKLNQISQGGSESSSGDDHGLSDLLYPENLMFTNKTQEEPSATFEGTEEEIKIKEKLDKTIE